MLSLGYCLDFAHRHDEALVQLRRAERLEKRDWSLHTCYGNAYLHLQQYEKVLEAYAVAIESGNEASIKASLGRVLHAYVRSQMGEQGALESTLAAMVDDPEEDSAAVAVGYFLLGQHDLGFEWLARARDERASWYLYILQEPLLDSVRDDPRYQEHLARLGIGPDQRVAT
jgi:tetratricopeptide (TPR) repeat protein